MREAFRPFAARLASWWWNWRHPSLDREALDAVVVSFMMRVGGQSEEEAAATAMSLIDTIRHGAPEARDDARKIVAELHDTLRSRPDLQQQFHGEIEAKMQAHINPD